MGRNDGSVIGHTKLVDNGPNSRRYNIVLISEGYRQDAGMDEMPNFHDQCNGFVRALYWTAPFHENWSAINIHRIDVRSNQSGIDDPVSCPDMTTGSGATVSTYFDGSTCGFGVRRVPSLDEWLVLDTVKRFVPEYHAVLVLLNNGTLVGAAGTLAKFSTVPGWESVAIHELGHLFGLADEYECYICNGSDSGRAWWGIFGPSEPNVTSDATRSALKWRDLVDSATALPTPASAGSGVVGAFEGARYFATGLYRPELTCKMRDKNVADYCAVCRRTIVNALKPFLSATPSLVLPQAVPATLTVRVVNQHKIVSTGGLGAYRVRFDVQSNLPPAANFTYSLRGSAMRPFPSTWPDLDVPVVLASANPYAPWVTVRGVVRVEDLDYWVPSDPAFRSAEQLVNIGFRRPALNGGVIQQNLNAADTILDSQVLALFPQMRGGRLGTQATNYYAQMEVEVDLNDPGFFTLHDNPGWTPRSVVWTPQPFKQNGNRAVYRFGRNGDWCWIQPEGGQGITVEGFVQQGLSVRVTGTDAIGQHFDITQRIDVAHTTFLWSKEFIQLPKIPKKEWPMRFERKSDAVVLEARVAGVNVVLKGYTLAIGTVQIELNNARIERAAGD